MLHVTVAENTLPLFKTQLIGKSLCKLPLFPAHWGLEFSCFLVKQKGNGLDIFQRGDKAERLVRSRAVVILPPLLGHQSYLLQGEEVVSI